MAKTDGDRYHAARAVVGWGVTDHEQDGILIATGLTKQEAIIQAAKRNKTVAEAEGPAEGEQTWTTEQLADDFKIVGFAMGYVVVERKADGVKGTLTFTHAPRLYFGWTEDE